jgi:hypothetical protein
MSLSLFWEKLSSVSFDLKKLRTLKGNFMSDTKAYLEQIQDTSTRAAEMKKALLYPVLSAEGTFMTTAEQKKVLNEGSIVSGTVYEGVGASGALLLAQNSRSLQHYCNKHGMPSDDLLASAHVAIENGIKLYADSHELSGTGSIFESVGTEYKDEAQMILDSASDAQEGKTLNTSDGIIMRDRMIGLVLPVMLQGISHRLATHIPAHANQSEIFKMSRVAMSTFGGLKKNDVIDVDYNGSYSCMDQRWQAPSGDGTKKGDNGEFNLNTADAFETKYPLKPKRCRIIVDHKVVGADNGSGNLSGQFSIGDAVYQVFGTAKYAVGKIEPKFDKPIPADVTVHIGFDVDIEKDPTLIPRVDHLMESRTLYPHESAINAGTTLQALWNMRREHNVELGSMNMQAMRNLLAMDKDRKVLSDLWFFAEHSPVREWDANYSDVTKLEHYQTLNEKLVAISSELMLATRKSGLVSIVADPLSAAILRYMPAPFFEPVAGYREIPQPHYAGKLFGRYDLFIDPSAPANKLLCCAKGTGYGEAGYVIGDAIPALSFKHPVMSELQYKSTLWSLGYRDIHPYDGEDYFMILSIKNNPVTEFRRK